MSPDNFVKVMSDLMPHLNKLFFKISIIVGTKNLINKSNSQSFVIVYKKTDEWYIEWQRVKANGTTGDNEWQRVTTSGRTNDNEWQRVVQGVATSDSKWQRVRMYDKKWQWMTTSNKKWQGGRLNYSEW